MIKKIIDAQAKAYLQPSSEIKEIDFRSLKGYKQAKDNETNRDHQDKNKNKSNQNPTVINNIHQP